MPTPLINEDGTAMLLEGSATMLVTDGDVAPANIELREDGSFELREDGSFELRE
jgi:hypothetical protein